MILGLVEKAKSGSKGRVGKPAAVYRISDKLNWFLTEKYDRLREEMGLVKGSIKSSAKAFSKAQEEYGDWLLESGYDTVDE